ncbi:MAG: hypothetical protein U0289_10340 [Cyclobacteriaceae bacterium]|nr:hypothetical protein [Cyclobacteriaceae bacterium]
MNPRKLILILVMLIVPMGLFAQPGNGGGDPDVPITGIEYLLGGGVLLGIRKLLKVSVLRKKKS